MTENEQLEMVGIINRQKAEIERLSVIAELGNMRANDYRVMRDRALKAEAEIEKLNKENENLLIRLCKKVNQESKVIEKLIKVEAVKEYHEKIKQKLLDKGFYPAIVKSVLDEAEKEMVGE